MKAEQTASQRVGNVVMALASVPVPLAAELVQPPIERLLMIPTKFIKHAFVTISYRILKMPKCKVNRTTNLISFRPINICCTTFLTTTFLFITFPTQTTAATT